MSKTTKVVKVPVRIEEEDDILRHVKYRALYRTMEEARNLGNLAIRYAIAFSLEEVPPEYDQNTGKKVPLDTRIYRILTGKRQFLNSGNVATLARNFAVKTFRNTTKDAWQGRKSLPTYRSLFVPFRHSGTTIKPVEENGQTQFIIHPQGFGTKWLSDELIEATGLEDAKGISIDKEQRRLVLKSKFSWKDKGAVDIVNRIVSGEYKMSDSQIQKGQRKGLTLFLTYSHEADKPDLDQERVCGVDLGVVVPAVCAINTGPQRRYLGDGHDVWAARSKFRAERRRQQKRQGQQSKGRNWKRSVKEDNWIHTYYHTLTRQVIKFCEQFGCGTIHMEDLTKLRQKEVETEYKRLLWVPAKFHDLLKYKADEKGIQVVKVNPRNTSKRCSACGHISKTNRKSQSQFVCDQCGNPNKPVNADYNAAKNLSIATGDVIQNGYLDDSSESDTLKQMDVLWEGSREG